MFPNGEGGMVFFEYNFLDQTQNRSRSNLAPSDANNDKEIKTNFMQLGGQYMFNRMWGAQVNIPYWSRNFKTLNSDTGEIDSFDHTSVGDIQLKGIYTGFSEDMATGLTFGLKLPTGDASYPNFDPDTEIGTGSTDFLLGVYHRGKITQDNLWNWFGQFQLQQPLISKPNYLPGNEINMSIGAYYNGWNISPHTKIAPILELLASARAADEGADANTTDSGYRRLLASPGVELDWESLRIYANVTTPLYQYYNGFQLAAPISYKLGTMFGF